MIHNHVQYYLYHLKDDAPAGIVVFLVALPLCLGIALASGAPLFSGLIAGLVGGLIVPWLSGSQLSVSGPAAGLTVIVFNAIETLGSFQGFLVACVLAGAIQLALGYLKAGIIGAFFPAAVIKGMLAAIGLILIIKQIPHATGYDTSYEGDESYMRETAESKLF
jgi:MFS superfamily sulfate permease-like transporter